MGTTEEKKRGYLLRILSIFLVFFIACFIIGFFRAKEHARINETIWIEKFVADNTKIITDKGIYKLVFKCPDIDTIFLFDLGTNTISEFTGVLDRNDNIERLHSDFLGSQSIELGIGIIGSTVLAVNIDSIKKLYIKKPRSGIGAIITAITAVMSGYYLGYSLGVPSETPEPDIVIPLLRKKENWKRIKKSAIDTIILLPYCQKSNCGSSNKDRFKYQLKRNVPKRFLKLLEFTKKISQVDYEIGNSDFNEAVEISRIISKFEPQGRIDLSYSIAKEILSNPLNWEYNPNIMDYEQGLTLMHDAIK